MANCTWKNCLKLGKHRQERNNGSEWAVLCDEHHERMESAVESFDAPLILQAWTLAQGGAEVATERMMKRLFPDDKS